MPEAKIDFKVGDWVYADDWCYGQIVSISGPFAVVEFTTDNGGGTMNFYISELTHAEPPKVYSSDPETNESLCYIMEEFDRLIKHAKLLGFDIRLSPESRDCLELYYHEDYPDLILVDKSVE